MYGSLISLLLLLLLWQTPPTLQQTETNPVVEIKLGKIQGTTLTSQYGAKINAFRGIPYAQPPIGNLRFAAPQPINAWNNTLKATLDSLVCPQPGIQIFMSEDCLKLNVFSRNLTGSAPVIVYIHGGANVLGSGHSLYEAGPQYLLDHDVVMVAFNYRLGALGFLSTRTKEAPGNFGYLDQVLALKWVKDHIAAFGGNPNLVTIFGMSAGSMAVTLHMASPLSKGLFHRAIAMSGSATNHYNIDNLYWTRKLARETSCPMYKPQNVVSCLRNVSWKTIMDICTTWEPYKFTNMKWNYEVDGYFLAAHPTEIFRNGNSNLVPLLIGFTKNELDFSVYHHENNSDLLNDLSVSFDKYAPEIFLYDGAASTETQDAPVSQKIQKFYLSETDGNVTPQSLSKFGEIFSDALLGHGIHRLVDLLRDQTPVYYYRMDYQGQRSLYADDNGVPRGVGHADDLQYIMPSLWYGTQFKLDHPDMFMVNRLTKWWTTFAATGVPAPEYEGLWNANVTLFIDHEVNLGETPFVERYALWDEMFPVLKNSAITIRLPKVLVALMGVLFNFKIMS